MAPSASGTNLSVWSGSMAASRCIPRNSGLGIVRWVYLTLRYKQVYTSMYMDRLSLIGTYQYVLVHTCLYLLMAIGLLQYDKSIYLFLLVHTSMCLYKLVHTIYYNLIPLGTVMFCLVLSGTTLYSSWCQLP